VKENIIGGILDVLHWASWVDYIGYTGLTPHVGTQWGTIPIYSNIHAVTAGALQTVRLEKKLTKLTSPRSHNSRCVVYAAAEEEADDSSCKAVALCADVEVAEHEGSIAVVGLSCRWSCRRTRGAMLMTETH